jgi:hypothetical protein
MGTSGSPICQQNAKELLAGFLQTVVADAADFGAGDGDLHFEVAGDLFLQLLVEAGLKFANLAAAETGHVDVVAGTVCFVIVAVASEMEKIEFVNEAALLEKVNGAVDGDEVDFGIDFLGAFEDLVHIEVLLGVVHDFQDDAALAGEANALFAEGLLERAGGFGGVEAFASGDAMRGCGSHERVPQREFNMNESDE